MKSLCTQVILAMALTIGLGSTAYATDAATPDSDTPYVLLTTNMGNITLKLYADKAPITVANFLRYVDSGHYDNTVFHRVINRFMVQGGGFDVDMVEKPTGDAIVNESKNRVHNVRGTVAMARTSDPDSASAQFFINQRSNFRLDWSPGKPGYAVFAEVVNGMDVVDFIATAKTGRALATTTQGQAPFNDVPVEPIIVNSATRVAAP